MDLSEIAKAAPALQHIVTTIVAGVPVGEIVKAILMPSANALGDRMKNRVDRLFEKSGVMLLDSGSPVQPVPDRLLIEIVRGASVEDNEDLLTMWAALLANAASPENAEIVTPKIVSILKEMSLDGAAILKWMVSRQEHHQYKSLIGLEEMATAYNRLGLGPVDLEVILGPRPVPPALATKSNIEKLGRCLNSLSAQGLVKSSPKLTSAEHTNYEHDITWLGASLVKACQPPKPKS